MKRFLFDQIASELEGSSNIRRRKVVFALYVLEAHPASQAADNNGDGHAGTANDGLSVADRRAYGDTVSHGLRVAENRGRVNPAQYLAPDYC